MEHARQELTQYNARDDAQGHPDGQIAFEARHLQLALACGDEAPSKRPIAFRRALRANLSRLAIGRLRNTLMRF